MTDPALRAAGFDPDCPDCQKAACSHREAWANDYGPTHRHPKPRTNDSRACPTCDGRKRPEADTCRRCLAAGVV